MIQAQNDDMFSPVKAEYQKDTVKRDTEHPHPGITKLQTLHAVQR